MSLRATPVTARIAAVLAPIVVGAGWAIGGGALDEGAAEVVADNPTLQRIDAEVAREPEVVVLGNSQAYGAIAPEVLTRGLELDGGVARLTFGAALPDLLTRMLSVLVFDRGHQPRVVLVPMAYDQLVSTRGPNDAQAAVFASVLQVAVPGLDAVGAGPRWFVAARTTWLQRKDAALDAVTRASATLSGTDDPAARLAEARLAVIGDAGLGNQARVARMIPVVEDRAAPEAPGAVGLDQTVLPALLDLAADHGAHVVVIGLPQRRAALQASATEVRALSRFLDARGGAFVDLSTLEVGDDEWLDDAHLGPTAAGRLSAALVEALTAMDALGAGPLRPLPSAARYDRVRRTGTMPSVAVTGPVVAGDGCALTVPVDLPEALSDTRLRELGLGFASPLTLAVDGVALEPQTLPAVATPCAGSFAVLGGSVVVQAPRAGVTAASLTVGLTDAVTWPARAMPREPRDASVVWVAPGTALVWEVDDGTTLAPSTQLTLAASAVVPGASAPSFAVDGQQVALRQEGHLWRADTDVDGAAGPRAVTLASPPDGPWLAVRWLAAERQGERVTWVGRPGDVPDHLALAGHKQGRVELVAPTEAPLDVGPTRTAVDGAVAFDLPPALAVLTGRALGRALRDPRFSACTPLVLTAADGSQVALDKAWTPQQPSVAVPSAGPWQLQRVASRSCRTNAWVYPGDTLRFQPPLPDALHAPADGVLVHASVLGDAPADLRVRLLVGADAVLDTTVTLVPGQDEVVLDADRAVPPWPRRVALELGTDDDAPYVLVRDAALRPGDAAVDALEPEDARLASLDAVLATGALGDVVEAHQGDVAPEVAVVADDPSALVITPRAAVAHAVCLPRVATASPVTATARVRVDDVPADAAAVRLEARWFDGDGQPVRTADGGLDLGLDGTVVPDAWQTLTVSGTRPGAAAVQACVRLPRGRGVLSLASFDLTPGVAGDARRPEPR